VGEKFAVEHGAEHEPGARFSMKTLKSVPPHFLCASRWSGICFLAARTPLECQPKPSLRVASCRLSARAAPAAIYRWSNEVGLHHAVRILFTQRACSSPTLPMQSSGLFSCNRLITRPSGNATTNAR
jgi:hypothetical protein